MTVAQLIEELRGCNPDDKVIIGLHGTQGWDIATVFVKVDGIDACSFVLESDWEASGAFPTPLVQDREGSDIWEDSTYPQHGVVCINPIFPPRRK